MCNYVYHEPKYNNSYYILLKYRSGIYNYGMCGACNGWTNALSIIFIILSDSLSNFLFQ